jgi:hypothetical protein
MTKKGMKRMIKPRKYRKGDTELQILKKRTEPRENKGKRVCVRVYGKREKYMRHCQAKNKDGK